MASKSKRATAETPATGSVIGYLVVVLGVVVVAGLVILSQTSKTTYPPNDYVVTPGATAPVTGIGSIPRYCTNPSTLEGSCSSTHKYCQPGQLRLICDCAACPAPLGSGSPCESFCNAGQTG